MKNLNPLILKSITFVLILLWVYTAASKLQDFGHFQAQMYKQALPHFLSTVLIWTLPVSEFVIAVLLIFEKSQRTGLLISAVFMFAFTCYVGLALLHVFGKVPCSCGGVIRGMGWKLHFFFNLFFLLLSILAIKIINRERSTPGR